MPNELEIISHVKVYQNIKAELCERLSRNQIAGGRLPPIRKLAKELGVGQYSLHKAIKELVTQGLLCSKPKLGTFINANPQDFLLEKNKTQNRIEHNLLDQPLANKSIQILYYRVSRSERFFLEAVDAFKKTIKPFGPKVTEDYIEHAMDDQLLERTEPDAMVVINPTQALKLMCGPSQSLVVINTTQHCNMYQEDRVDLIAIDDVQGGILAGKYLKRQGWSDVCFIGVNDMREAPRYDKTSLDRLEGINRGLGRPIPPEWQIHCKNYEIVYGAMAANEWLKLSPRPSAIFAGSDDIAFGFINGTLGHNLRPNFDYQIIGLDGQQMGTDVGIGTLTTVGVPMSEMGKLAAKMLVERFNNPQKRPRRILLGCDLIEGNTVRTQ